jgi:hypothetical protein
MGPKPKVIAECPQARFEYRGDGCVIVAGSRVLGDGEDPYEAWKEAERLLLWEAK